MHTDTKTFQRDPKPAFWLFKTEPEEFSIDDLKRVGREPWTGIRNYQARNLLRDQAKVGDQVFVYHSSCAVPGVVGVAEIVSASYPDPSQFDPNSDYYDPASKPAEPRWLCLDVAYNRQLKRPLTLEQLKTAASLDGFLLLKRGNRLSLFPVPEQFADQLLNMEHAQ